jgi:RNA polymerase sigma-70 factor (ECF subfamily)
MSGPDSSFHLLLRRLRGGSDEAAQRVVRQFSARLIALAASRLGTGLQRKVDPEDAVQSVFRSFFGRCAAGEFPTLVDWDSLWGLLACITTRKCANLRIHHRRSRRALDAEVPITWDVISGEPTPEEVVMMDDLLEQTTRDLAASDQQIVQLWLLGCDAKEIARDTGRSERTIYRTLALVKKRLQRIWSEEPAVSPNLG